MHKKTPWLHLLDLANVWKAAEEIGSCCGLKMMRIAAIIVMMVTRMILMMRKMIFMIIMMDLVKW